MSTYSYLPTIRLRVPPYIIRLIRLRAWRSGRTLEGELRALVCQHLGLTGPFDDPKPRKKKGHAKGDPRLREWGKLGAARRWAKTKPA